jgi:hypothetical protein
MDRTAIKNGINEMIEKGKVVEKFKVAGLPVPKKPKTMDNVVDIFDEWENLKNNYGGTSNIPFNEIGEYLDKWTNLIAYTRWLEAISDIKQSSAREIKNTVEKQLYVIQDGGRELRAASVATEPLFIEWENKYIEDNSYHTLLKGLREGYEYRLNAVSREISRRTAEINNSGRSYNINER